MDKTVAALEVTSKQIKIVVGYELDGQVFVLYTLSKPINGLVDNGKIIDPETLGKEIAKVADIYDGQAKLKIKISDILLILPSCGIEIFQAQRMTNVISDELKVSQIDISNVYTMIRNGRLPVDNVLIDIVPNTYVLDNNRIFFQPPYNETSRTVMINAKVHTLPQSVSNGYFKSVHNAGLKIKHSIVAPFASSEFINTYENMPSDYFLVDIGSKMTSVALIGKKQLFSGRTFFFGGDNITERISDEFGISFEDAEHLKILYGIDDREMTFKPSISKGENENGEQIDHYPSELNAIIKSELDEFLKSLRAAIEEILTGLNATYKKLPMILIGGGSLLNGLVKYITPKIDNDTISTITPKTLGARDPSLFNCLGAILVHSKYPVTVDDDQPKIGNVSRNLK